ncbi:YdiU family protein [Sulfurimonas sp. HSL-3221]|uniref:protein adenylyltransferase SelO n=1 Tax=Thiomicrolovo sulfuroxydans TaxID=2894755 RepID=UPI001E43CC4A|nr:YdiU family protein [Sulfurimonas sp. HSL-3221]UFS63661.1 YdiU family protein [Sulfurimonas sp. HSL-3221]
MTLDALTLDTPYLSLDPHFYDPTEPTPLKNPYLISFNPDAAELIGLSSDAGTDDRLVGLLNGTFLPEGSRPFAMCYAGHQFGMFVPRLGDGRAINLGKSGAWNLQLKGSGETLYSRMGDGRAVLRSSVREYLMSEAMHHLGIPTTRALALIGSETKVVRERLERGAVVLRMSPTWVRIGTFEYFYYKEEHDKLEPLADYVIAESYPHLQGEEDAYFLMFAEVVERTARLLAQWQSVGFNHGVMNTDNMSMGGLTIDYGPYAMLDDYDISFICNHTDTHGRYGFGQQPHVAYWNLSMLAEAMSPIVSKERMEKKLDDYGSVYTQTYVEIMCSKMGLATEKEDDIILLKKMLTALQKSQADYTLFFRTLSRYDGDGKALLDICVDREPVREWLTEYDARLRLEEHSAEERRTAMLRTNPKYVLKNYMLQEAIKKAEKFDNSGVEELLEIARNPFDELPQFERYAKATPNEHKNLKLSCSS